MAGLIGTGVQTRQRAIGGLQQAGEMHTQREIAGDAAKTAEQGQKVSLTASGAGLGFMVGGPIGGLVGAAGGYLLSEIF